MVVVERGTTLSVSSSRTSADRNARNALTCIGNCGWAQCRLRKRKSVCDLAARAQARLSDSKITVKRKSYAHCLNSALPDAK